MEEIAGRQHMHNYVPILRRSALIFTTHSYWGGTLKSFHSFFAIEMHSLSDKFIFFLNKTVHNRSIRFSLILLFIFAAFFPPNAQGWHHVEVSSFTCLEIIPCFKKIATSNMHNLRFILKQNGGGNLRIPWFNQIIILR